MTRFSLRALMQSCKQAAQLAVILWFACGCGCTRPSRFDTMAVRGTPDFQTRVTDSLALLKTKAPEAYGVVTNEIGVIEQAKHSGMCAWLNPPKFQLHPSQAFYSTTWCAGVIAHDSFHSRLYHNYLRQYPGQRRVPDAIWKGEGPENRCMQHQIEVLTQLRAPFHELAWCRQTNRYWEVKYQDRNW